MVLKKKKKKKTHTHQKKPLPVTVSKAGYVWNNSDACTRMAWLLKRRWHWIGGAGRLVWLAERNALALFPGVEKGIDRADNVLLT